MGLRPARQGHGNRQSVRGTVRGVHAAHSRRLHRHRRRRVRAVRPDACAPTTSPRKKSNGTTPRSARTWQPAKRSRDRPRRTRSPLAATPPAPQAKSESGATGRVRTYYVAAEEVEWDYAPLGKDMATGKAFAGPSAAYTQPTRGDSTGTAGEE